MSGKLAMGRAITREPAAFLMDEPLSNLDAKLRVGEKIQLAIDPSRFHFFDPETGAAA